MSDPKTPPKTEAMMEKEVEFIPLLLASHGQMASRRMLHEYGVSDAMIDAAEALRHMIVQFFGLQYDRIRYAIQRSRARRIARLIDKL
jgi:hypothetical protein